MFISYLTVSSNSRFPTKSVTGLTPVAKITTSVGIDLVSSSTDSTLPYPDFISLILAEVSIWTPFFCTKFSMLLPISGPSILSSGVFWLSRIVMLTLSLSSNFKADDSSSPIKPPPIMVIFLSLLFTIVLLIFSKSRWLRRVNCWISFAPGIGGTTGAVPVAMRRLS